MTPTQGLVALCLLASCDRGDSDPTPLWAQAAYDCIPLEQEAPDGKTVPSGYEYCSVAGTNDGFVHRVGAVDIAIDPTVVEHPSCGSKKDPRCANNADCSKGSVCENDAFGDCDCVEKCRTDAECGAGYVCVPNAKAADASAGLSGNYECAKAECLTDEDCPSHWCVVSWNACGSGFVGSLHCFGPQDECLTEADCDSDPLCHVVDGAFRCDGQSDCI